MDQVCGQGSTEKKGEGFWWESLLENREMRGMITLRWKVDQTGSGSCVLADFGVTGVDLPGSTTR